MNKLVEPTKEKRSFIEREGVKTFLSSLICIAIGLVFGIILILIIDAQHAGEAILKILKGGFNLKVSKLRGIAGVITHTAPLILCSLSVTFAYKCGIFNIGVAGQYVGGILFLYLAAIGLQLHWTLCLLFAIFGGIVVGILPGLMKAFLGVNEVITGIMFNWITLFVTNFILSQEIYYNQSKGICYDLRTAAPKSILPTLGLEKVFDGYQYIGLGVIIAIVAAVVLWVVLSKTKFGFEVKATGSNKSAAKYSGMNEKRNIILTLVISGGFAGLSAGCLYLTGIAQYTPLVSSALPAMGFNGIVAGFLGGLHPIGAIFASLLITHISVGGSYLDTTYYSREISDFITALIIYSCAFSMVIKNLLTKLKKRKKSKNNSADESEDVVQTALPNSAEEEYKTEVLGEGGEQC